MCHDDDDLADQEEDAAIVDWARANREDKELLLEALSAAPAGGRRCYRLVRGRRGWRPPGGR